MTARPAVRGIYAGLDARLSALGRSGAAAGRAAPLRANVVGLARHATAAAVVGVVRRVRAGPAARRLACRARRPLARIRRGHVRARVRAIGRPAASTAGNHGVDREQRKGEEHQPRCPGKNQTTRRYIHSQAPRARIRRRPRLVDARHAAVQASTPIRFRQRRSSFRGSAERNTKACSPLALAPAASASRSRKRLPDRPFAVQHVQKPTVFGQYRSNGSCACVSSPRASPPPRTDRPDPPPPSPPGSTTPALPSTPLVRTTSPRSSPP
jgi:hypothetical protein